MSQRTCPTCQNAIVRRDKENAERFALRVFCDKRCFQKARRSTKSRMAQVEGSWEEAGRLFAGPLP